MSISLVYIFKIMKSHSSRMTNQIQFPSGPLGMIEFTFHHLTTQIPLESCNLMDFYLNWTSFPLKSPKPPILDVFLCPDKEMAKIPCLTLHLRLLFHVTYQPFKEKSRTMETWFSIKTSVSATLCATSLGWASLINKSDFLMVEQANFELPHWVS